MGAQSEKTVVSNLSIQPKGWVCTELQGVCIIIVGVCKKTKRVFKNTIGVCKAMWILYQKHQSLLYDECVLDTIVRKVFSIKKHMKEN